MLNAAARPLPTPAPTTVKSMFSVMKYRLMSMERAPSDRRIPMYR